MAKKEEVKVNEVEANEVEVNEVEKLKLDNKELKRVANALIERLKQEKVKVNLTPETEKLLNQ